VADVEEEGEKGIKGGGNAKDVLWSGICFLLKGKRGGKCWGKNKEAEEKAEEFGFHARFPILL